MHVLVTYKNEVDSYKNEVARVSQDFSHYKSMWIFQDAQEPIENEGASVFTTFSPL